MKKLLVTLGLIVVAVVTGFGQGQTPPNGSLPATDTPVAAPAQATPQTPPPPQAPTFRTSVDLVTVDVGVVDGSGNPIDDLRAPDFTVKIDGEVRRVVSAELVRVNVEEAKRKVEDKTETFFTTNLTPPEGRQIVIAVDQVNIGPGTLKTLMTTAQRFLDKLSPLDQVAFVAYPPPGPRVSFTRDRLRVKLAMEQLIGHQNNVHPGRLNIGMSEALAIDERRDQIVFDDVTRRECNQARTPDQLAECQRDIQMESSQIAQRAREDSEASMRGLMQLLRELALVDGAKSMILFSEGLASTSPADIDLVGMLAGRARTALNVLMVDARRGDIAIAQAPTSANEDRQRYVGALQGIATSSRGGLFHAVGTAEGVFQRLLAEMSAFYVLGVEQRPADLVGDRHRVDVEVRRRGVTIRSPQAFALSTAARPKMSPEENLRSTLLSPFPVSEIPLRVTTFAQQEPGNGKVRLLVAAEVGQPGSPTGNYNIAYIMVDGDNRVVASFDRRAELRAPAQLATEALGFLGTVVVDPGVYSLRLAVVDDAGRRGSVIRDVNAWKMDDEELTFSDLIIGNVPKAGEGLSAAVEPHVATDTVAAFLELYSTKPDTFDNTTVRFEIADDPDGPALMQLPATVGDGRIPAWRTAIGVMGARALPPGKYVARAHVQRDGKVVSVLSRPFVLERGVAGAPAASSVAFAAGVPKFNRDPLLEAGFLKTMIDSVDRRSPTLKDAMVEARAGRYGSAALEALAAGDQQAAAFLRGLDLFAKGQLDGAATQLQISLGPQRDFFPAAVYLGAAFASAGRDRDAAGVWQSSMGTEPRPTLVYAIAADARLRDGSPSSAIDILKPAWERTPTDQELARRLGIAYVAAGRYADAIPVLDGALTRAPTDPALLFAAIAAQHEVVRTGQILSNDDRTKIRRYAAAYKGDQRALVDKYLESMGR